MAEHTFRAAQLRETQINAGWASHRLSFGFDGPPEWCTEQRRLLQQTIDRHRVNIAAIKAQQSALVPFGENRDDLPKFLKRAAAAE